MREMYNLTVDEAHTFYVGDGQWLVHNAGCRDDILKMLKREDLTWDDIDALRNLVKQDIESSGGIIKEIEFHAGKAGQYFKMGPGEPGGIQLTPIQNRSTLIHEWVHFDRYRQMGWPTYVSEAISKADHAMIFQWQIANQNAILYPHEFSVVASWAQELLIALTP